MFVNISFFCNITAYGDTVGIVGSSPVLGEWKSPILLESIGYPVWTKTIRVLEGNMEYKFVIIRNNEIMEWEPLDINRKLSVDNGDLCCTWGVKKAIFTKKRRPLLVSTETKRRIVRLAEYFNNADKLTTDVIAPSEEIISESNRFDAIITRMWEFAQNINAYTVRDEPEYVDIENYFNDPYFDSDSDPDYDPASE